MAGLTVNPADIAKAREAGYSDDEIAGFLSNKAPDQFKQAQDAGYSSKEILDHLTGGGDKSAPKSGIIAGAQKGLADLAQGVGSTLRTFTGSDPTGLEERGKSAQQPTAETHWYDPSTYPQALAEAAPGMVTDIAAAKLASRLPVIGKYAGPAAGVASYLLRTSGDKAKNDAVIRTGDQNAEPEAQDKIRALATGAADAVPQAIGVGRFLPGGVPPSTVAGALKKALGTGFVEAAKGGAQAGIDQIGATIGTPGGVQMDPNQMADAAVTNGILGGGMAVPKAISEAHAARKYAPLGGDNQAATEALVNRVQNAPGGDNLSSTSDAFTALKTAHNAVKAELKAATKPIKNQLDPETQDALRRAGRGDTLNDDDLQNIEANTSPDVAHLARQAHVATLVKGMGDYGNGQFVGGMANSIGKHVWSVRNPIAAAIGAAGLNGGFEGMMAHSPEALAAIGGTYMGLKALDKMTGARSPMASIAARFQNDGTPVRLPQPAPEPSPSSGVGPTGPNVPFNPGVANGGALLATGQSPWTPNPNAPKPPIAYNQIEPLVRGELAKFKALQAAKQAQAAASAPQGVDAKALEPLVRGELQKFNALQKAQGARAAEGLAADSPFINDNGGLETLKQPGFGDAASKLLSAANAYKKLTAQPEEEAPPASPETPSPVPASPSAPGVSSMADILQNISNATKAKAKISKKVGAAQPTVEAPPAAEAPAPYAPIPDAELWRKGMTDQQVADRQLAEYDPVLREKYSKNIIGKRVFLRDKLGELASDDNTADTDGVLMGRLYHQLDHVSRRAEARRAIAHFTEKMSPEAAEKVRSLLNAKLNRLWSQE